MRYHRLSVLFPLTTPWDNTRVKHMWDATPADWEALGHPPAGTTIDLRIALIPHHGNALIDVLNEVSNPAHPKYGAYLSKDQVAELVAPSPGTLELVNAWLEHHGISSSSVSTTHWRRLAYANDLLGASYQLYRYTGTNENVTILRTLVVPTTHFGFPHVLQQIPRKRSRGESAAMKNATSREPVTVLLRSDDGDGGDGDGDDDGDGVDEDYSVDPSYLRWLYKTSAYIPAATDRNALAVNLRDDLGDDAKPATYTVVPVNWRWQHPVHHSHRISDPANLLQHRRPYGDINNKPAPGDGWLEWLEFVMDLEEIPQTIAISYGTDELGLSQEYAKALCDMFLRLGLLGVTVLISSGDYGVGRGDCKDQSGKVQFNLLFPASCTCGVSGRSLSQGGFSLLFDRPDYQEGAVTAFLENLGSDGTSCSTPTVAGIISLLNDYRLSQGKTALGFLNYWLYGSGSAGLTDITDGSNPGCKTDGFSAIKGWDPVRPTKLVSLHWLILGSIGHGSRDAQLRRTAENST
ncbi:subtilisin-like protein [Lactarius indigo]|nr:subtilisin-like protein [Lactarius indigo]